MVTSELTQILDTLTKEERSVLETILSDTEMTEINSLYDLDYTEVPVSIDTFISDPRYLGSVYDGGNLIYPYWRQFMHDFFHNNPNKAYEVALSGAIGIGKSTIAAVMMTYLIYRTLCLRDPRKFYRLTGNAPIVFVVMNLTLDLAYQGLYTLIVENIKESPWFKERVEIRGKYDYTIEFGNGIDLIAGSNTQHVIGKNVIAATLDEVNFSNAPKGSKNSVMDMYRSIKRRMESRFMKLGNLPGMIGLISSKNDENSFLETYIESNKFNTKTIVVDKPIYEIKPPSDYLGPRFDVAVGDKTKMSFLVTTDADRKRAEDSNQRIISVPVEYRKAFEDDINEALKEISGISVFSTSKLIAYPNKIYQCVNVHTVNPIGQETIYMSLDTDESISDYLEDIGNLKKDLHLPRFLHCDIGLTGDSLGLVAVHVPSNKLIPKTSITGELENISEPNYKVDFVLRVRAAKGSEVPLYKIREFILYLKHTMHWKIGMMTFDGFQSTDSIQILSQSHIPTGLQSVDRTDIPYLVLRSAIIDERLDMPEHQVLLRELSDLEYDRSNHKVDHPVVTIDNLPGSKDVSDALCGAVYDASVYYSSKDGVKRYSQPATAKNNLLALEKYRKSVISPNKKEESWVLQ